MGALLSMPNASAQTIDEFSAVMTRIGCGAEFSKAANLPVPLQGYSARAEQRIGPTSEMRTTARGVVGVDFRNPDTIRKRLLLDPINAVDAMNPAQARSALAEYVSARDSEEASEAARFEKGVAATMICLLEKRKGLTPEPRTVEAKLQKLNDPECGGHVAMLLAMYKPPPHPIHELIMKNILDGQSGGGPRSTGSANAGSSNFDISRVAAPASFRAAFAARVDAIRDYGFFLASKEKNLRLVPSKEEQERWNAWEHNHGAALTLADYWVCRRASQEKVFHWLDQSPDRFIYWTAMGPSAGAPKLDGQAMRLFKARIGSKDGVMQWTGRELLHTCLNQPAASSKSEQQLQQESGLPLCNSPNSTRLSPELSRLEDSIKAAVAANTAVYIAAHGLGRSRLCINPSCN